MLTSSLLRPRIWLLLVTLWVSIAGAQTAAKKVATIVGSDTCSVCHEDIYKIFQTTPHRAIDNDKRRGWAGKACEACHGPGSLHVDSADAKDIRNPGKLPASEADKLCLPCRLNQPTQVGRIQGPHVKNQVGCAACHSMHKGGGQVARTPADINAKCASCHTAQWARFQLPYTHKLPQGAMSCVDCHNPHGSQLTATIRTVSANEPGCFKCHGDKRGPFAYEHAPVRLEGCTVCHQPHGSANPRMLIRQEVRFVCLECHANRPAASVQTLSPTLGGIPPAIHDLQNPRYRNCTICHVKIHGSHVDRSLLR